MRSRTTSGFCSCHHNVLLTKQHVHLAQLCLEMYWYICILWGYVSFSLASWLSNLMRRCHIQVYVVKAVTPTCRSNSWRHLSWCTSKHQWDHPRSLTMGQKHCTIWNITQDLFQELNAQSFGKDYDKIPHHSSFSLCLTLLSLNINLRDDVFPPLGIGSPPVMRQKKITRLQLRWRA